MLINRSFFWSTIFFTFVLFFSCIVLDYSPISYGLKEKNNRSNVVKIGIQYSSFQLDPHACFSQTSISIAKHLYEGLTYINSSDEVVPGAAESITFHPETNSYIFQLRPSCWSDNTPVTTYDFERSWKRALSIRHAPLSPYMDSIFGARAFSEGNIEWEKVGIICHNEKILEVRLERPSPSFLFFLSLPVFYPMHIEEKNNMQSPTNGPYYVHEGQFEDYLEIRKNPFFWAKDKISLQRIRFCFIHDRQLALPMLEKNELDFCEVPDNIHFFSDNLRTEHRLHILNHTYRTRIICISPTEAPLSNKNIRKALHIALDRQQLTQYIPRGIPTECITIPTMDAIEKYSVIPIKNDIAYAQELLAKGLQELNMSKEDFKKAVLYFPSTLASVVFQAIQQQWRDVLGITIPIRVLDTRSSLEAISKGESAMYALTWCPDYPDRLAVLEIFGKDELLKLKWNSEHFDTCIQAVRKEISHKKRQQLLTQAEQQLLDESIVIPLYIPCAVFASHHRLKNFHVSPMHVIDFSRAFLDENC